MSKSYRYDPDAGDYADRPSWERDNKAESFDGDEAFECAEETPARTKRAKRKSRDANPHPPMTPEWTIELMKGKVALTVSALVSQRVIPPHEREDYVQEFNILVWNALSQFDPGRVDESGNTVGVERFLSVVIENAAKNVKMRIARRRKNVPLVPFVDLGEEDGDVESDGGEDGPSCDANPYKAHRHCMEALWVKMDLEVLSRRLSMEERLTLSCRLAEFTYQAIADYVSDKMGVSVQRYHILETTMPHLQDLSLGLPKIGDDEDAVILGDAETGFIVKPSKTDAVIVTIPDGVDAAKVTVQVAPETKTVAPNGAAVKVVRGEADITDYLDIPAADASGVIDLNAATVKEEIAKATLSVEDGAEINLSAENPVLTTAETKPGLKYQLYEGETLSDLKAGDSTVGDGTPWTPTLSVTGGTSGFYTIQVTK